MLSNTLITWLTIITVTFLLVHFIIIRKPNTFSQDATHEITRGTIVPIETKLTNNGNGQDLTLPSGLYQSLPWMNFNLTAAKLDVDMETAFHRFINQVDLLCVDRVRFGKIGKDGGWDMCLAGPYQPTVNHCLVYSFGISHDMSFDDAISDAYNCTLRTFDPTIPGQDEEFRRGNFIHFYPVGLHGSNNAVTLFKHSRQRAPQAYPMRTLQTLIEQLGDENKIIDYLKIDIEESEWPALANMYQDGHLSKYVKQIGIELHLFKGTFRLFLEAMQKLEELGFRKWFTNWNMHCRRASKRLLRVTYCYEVYFVNINFMI